MTAAAGLIRSGRQHGFTYLSVVILVAVIGLVGAASLRLGVTLQRVSAEEELLRIGAEYSDALQSYAAATPAGQPTFPPSLKELLKDPRFPQVRRHLRRIYVDPVTGKAEWGLVRAGISKPGALPGASQGAMPGSMPGAVPGMQAQPAPGAAMSASEGGIIGIYSLSTAQPIKIGNFAQRFVSFEGKASISDWKFTAETALAPVTTAIPPGSKPPVPGAPGTLPVQPQPPGQPPMPPPAQPPAQPPQPAPEEPAAPPEPPAEPPPEPPKEPEAAEPAPAPAEPENNTNEVRRRGV